MNKTLPIILIFALCTVSAKAQETKEVQIESESFQARQVDGMTVIELFRPILTHEETRLTAVNGLDEGNGYVRFWGSVRIVEKEDTIRADRIRYHKDSKVAVVQGNISMSDGEAFLTAPSAVHFSEADSTTFDDGVSYRDSLTVLTAERAIYLSENNRAHFSSRVTLSQDQIQVYSDSLVYERDTERSWAWGRILVEQESDSSLVFMMADVMRRQAKVDSVQLTGNGLMATIDAAQKDTLYVSAERYWMHESDSLRTVIASDSVIVASSAYTTRTDSLVSKSGEADVKRSQLFGTPFIWLEDTQVTADSLTMLSTPSQPDSVFGFGEVFVATLESASERIQQIKAQRLVAVLDQDSLRSLKFEENAEALFYSRERDDDPLTAVRASADGAIFYFTGGEVDSLGFYDGIEGTYYSESQMDKLSNLAGYIWVPENKPDRDEMANVIWSEIELRRRHGLE
ncbi:MAG TPA: hypothetical protein DCY57_03320 [Bacteroidetes bacterium]|nr:hypothetical protein [Bacteroidota bacterium]